MKNNDFAKMQKLAFGKVLLKENQESKDEYKTGYDILDFFDHIPEFQKYKIEGAEYDETRYSIPQNIFNKKLPQWNEEFIKNLDDNLEAYTGGIGIYDGNVEITGGA